LIEGQSLFREGDDVERIYEVRSGVLRLTRMFEDGCRQVVAFGYPGDVVGFPFEGEHRTDCDALTETTLTSFPREALENSERDPLVHSHLMQAGLREISSLQDHCMILGRKSAHGKVASFLSLLSNRVGEPIGQYTQFELPMSRCDIADFLGLSTETISRSITSLRNSGTIAIDRINTVVIVKPDQLDACAKGTS
jgi:CRP-like cAMP-binding protein